ncbi:MAG: hypothetical protein L0H53_06020 [Candidatus Nitrosocosmicus sp.]|nr:hypothetical protein [Candidatus Nitrosocosmicus sp.]MDN5866885.1 hypothetical protein [Candidatus Nitrosocosmicus sp.]
MKIEFKKRYKIENDPDILSPKIKGTDNLELTVIRQKDLIKKSEQNPIPVEQFVKAEQQVSITRGEF